MRYAYRVIKSESPTMNINFEFVSENKLHDDRLKKKIVELSDVDCRDYTLELLKIYTDKEWENYKMNHKVKLQSFNR